MQTDELLANGHVSFESAAQHATPRVPIVSINDRVIDARRARSARQYDCASPVAVCEGPLFRGVIRIEDLLAAPDEARIDALMDGHAPVVAPGVDQEVAAWEAVRKGESALAVVDARRRFVGIIPPHRLLAVLLAEHEGDLSHLGGFIRGEAQTRRSSEEPLQRRFRHRVPWLLVGLVGALLAADVVSRFEEQLRSQVMLAFFIPAIVYLADAVGTQTETIVVRGLSIGIPMRRMLARELLVGAAIGMALGGIGGPAVWWLWGRADVALCVGLSIVAACSTATVAALSMPWLLRGLGLDPAFGSGPMATVVQDLLSILIYFGIAAAVVN